MSNQKSQYIDLRVETRAHRGTVAWLTVDYERRLNILNSESIARLTSAIGMLAQQEDLRVLILTGAGTRAFIGGADINEMGRLDPASARTFITSLHELCEALRKAPVPVIARIQGYCLGAGLEVAASCDLRIATGDSSFGMPEVLVGIPSVIEAALLPNLIGWGKARELIYTGKIITADEALACGLVEKVVPSAGLDRAVDEWVESILTAGPQAIRIQKELIKNWEQSDLAQAIELGIEAFVQAYQTDEPSRLMTAFLDRKK